jgi:hypothetical protein
MNKKALKKTCKTCGIEKALDQFYFRKDQNRYLNICIECKKKSNKKYYLANKVELLEYQSNYYNENKKDRLEYQNKYYEDNKEDVRTQQVKYRLQNQDKIEKLNQQYYADNKNDILLQKRHYRQKNHKQIIEKNLRYKKQKRLSDPSFRLRENVSRMIFQGLKKSGSSKNGSSCLDYLSYSFIELFNHIEKRFESWMTWENQGQYNSNVWDNNDSSTWTWQLDHIIPQSDLPYTSMKDENFQKCWALENLRPLSSKQNLLDGVNRTRHGVK